MAQVEEPLLESAPLAWRLAPQLCRKDPESANDCSAVHGLWQYLRILRLVGLIENRAGFYRDALKSVAGNAGAPRVLISGAADYAMLAHALAAFRGRGVEPDMTVVDLCETPLMLNRWYAERESLRVATARGDILAYAPSAPFDAICADLFIARFPPAARPALLASWKAMLRPGGLVITMARLRPGAAGARVAFSKEQASALCAAVRESAAAVRRDLQVEPEELARQAARYAAQHVTYAVSSAAELRELFETAGFGLEELSVRTVTVDSGGDVSGPSARRSGEYAQISARRP